MLQMIRFLDSTCTILTKIKLSIVEGECCKLRQEIPCELKGILLEVVMMMRPFRSDSQVL
jgi:hypothetical protein